MDHLQNAYKLGAQKAQEHFEKHSTLAERSAAIALEKALTSTNSAPARAIMKALEKLGPKGGSGFAATAPFLAPIGGIAGGITGAATANEGERGRKTLLGALLGMGISGLAAGTHGALRSHLSKIPSKLSIERGGTIVNPAAEKQFKRIFGEAAAIAGAGGIGGGLLATR